MQQQPPTKSKLPQKQLLKIALFRSVRQINGQRIFKQLHETCYTLSYESRHSDKQQSLKQNFIYVKQGEVLVYKMINGSTGKSLMKSYRMDEYCGFQDYPLFWGEEFVIQVNVKTVLIIVPLDQFYRFFRRVIPMVYLQSKAEFLKRLAIFRGIQLDKIFKLACLSQKYRIPKEKEVMKQGDPIENILIVFSGRLELKSSIFSQVIVVGQNEQFLVKEVKNCIEICCFNVKCTQEADVLVIPKNQFKRIMDIRYNFTENKLKQGQTKDIAIFEDNKSQKSLSSGCQNLSRNRVNFSRSLYGRSATENDEGNNYRNLRSAQRTTFSKDKTLQSDTQGRKMAMTQTKYSLGEIQLLKFIKRKQKIENRNFFKYIESRAPQIVLNPSKQFALVKPFYKSTSQYVRNMKRRLKQSMCLNQSVNLTGHFNDLTL